MKIISLIATFTSITIASSNELASESFHNNNFCDMSTKSHTNINTTGLDSFPQTQTCAKTKRRRFIKLMSGFFDKYYDRQKYTKVIRSSRPISEVNDELRGYSRDLLACYNPHAMPYIQNKVRSLSVFLAVKRGIFRCLLEIENTIPDSEDTEMLPEIFLQTMLHDVQLMNVAANSDCSRTSKDDPECIHFSPSMFWIEMETTSEDAEKAKNCLLTVGSESHLIGECLKLFEKSRSAYTRLREVDTRQIMSENSAAIALDFQEDIRTMLLEIRGRLNKKNGSIDS